MRSDECAWECKHDKLQAAAHLGDDVLNQARVHVAGGAAGACSRAGRRRGGRHRRARDCGGPADRCWRAAYCCWRAAHCCGCCRRGGCRPRERGKGDVRQGNVRQRDVRQGQMRLLDQSGCHASGRNHLACCKGRQRGASGFDGLACCKYRQHSASGFDCLACCKHRQHSASGLDRRACCKGRQRGASSFDGLACCNAEITCPDWASMTIEA